MNNKSFPFPSLLFTTVSGLLGSRCASGRGVVGGPSSAGSAAMDDILIVTARQSEPAILWANYLKTRFDKITKQRGRVPFK